MGLFDFLKRTGSDPDAATPEAREAIARQHRFETLRDDGVRAMHMGEHAFAAKCLGAALELEPDDLKTTGYMAECLLRMQDFASARPLLERLTAADPNNVEVRLLFVTALERTGDIAAMRTAADALRAEFPDEPRAVCLAADAAHRQGDSFSAIALLTQILQANEDDTAARQLRARILADMGQWNEALQDTAVLADGTGEADNAVLQLHGDALAATGQDEAARTVFERMLENDPFDREAVLRLGALCEATADYGRALSVYDEAVALQPDFAEAYKRRGGVKLALHDEAGAADDLKRSLELQPAQAESIDGEFSNVENSMNARYRAMNPYGF